QNGPKNTSPARRVIDVRHDQSSETTRMSNTMWGGRVVGRPAEAMEEISASIDFGRKLGPQDIAGSQAHVAMLAAQGIVEAADAEAIARGLAQVKGEIEAGTFSF